MYEHIPKFLFSHKLSGIKESICLGLHDATPTDCGYGFSLAQLLHEFSKGFFR